MKDIRILRSRKIFGDGRHNAFTSIAEWNNSLFIAFRTAENHLAPNGEIRVIQSRDNGETWSIAHCFAMEKHDLRDPHIIVFDGKLHLFCFGLRFDTQYREDVDCKQPGQDFFKFNKPTGIYSFHAQMQQEGSFSSLEELPGVSAIWGINSFGGMLYASCYQESSVKLLNSADGFHWHELQTLPFPGNEAAIDFDPDGSLWALVRDTTNNRCYGSSGIPTLCRIEPPYTNQKFWSVSPAIRLQGPMLKRLPGASLIVGRRWNGGEHQRHNLRTEILLKEDEEEIRSCAILPSGGDTSYADCLVRPGKRLLLSYYSSHEYKMDLPFEEDNPANPAKAEHSTPADIYLAELATNF